MIEWRVVGALAVLVPLFMAIIKPIVNSTKAMNDLNVTLAQLRQMIEDDRASNMNDHIRMDRRISDNADEIKEHEKRLSKLESR